MLAMKPVLINCSSGEMYLHDESFLIEPKVVYRMHTCEYGHTIPDEDCGCGIVTHLDFKNMRAALELPDKIDWKRVPAIGVFQVLGETVVDEESQTLRSAGLYYYGTIFPEVISSMMKKPHLSMYSGVSFGSIFELLRHVVICGFDPINFTGFFPGATGD